MKHANCLLNAYLLEIKTKKRSFLRYLILLNMVGIRLLPQAIFHAMTTRATNGDI